jgi:hypothetical protein
MTMIRMIIVMVVTIDDIYMINDKYNVCVFGLHNHAIMCSHKWYK